MSLREWQSKQQEMKREMKWAKDEWDYVKELFKFIRKQTTHIELGCNN